MEGIDQQLRTDIEQWERRIACRKLREEIRRKERTAERCRQTRAEARSAAETADVTMQRWCAIAEKGYGVSYLMQCGCPESIAKLLVLGR